MQRIRPSNHDGFTLIETVVATGILVTALAGIAQLLALSVRTTREAGAHTAALAAAADKIEVLRSLAFTFDPVGAPITDPALAGAGGGLAHDTAGFADHVGVSGEVVDPDSDAAGPVFTRRWRITALDQSVPEALVIEVCVFRWPAGDVPLRAAVACLATVRVRQP